MTRRAVQVDYFRSKLIRNDINLVLLTQNYAINVIRVQNGWIKSCKSIQSSLSLIYSVCWKENSHIIYFKYEIHFDCTILCYCIDWTHNVIRSTATIGFWENMAMKFGIIWGLEWFIYQHYSVKSWMMSAAV